MHTVRHLLEFLAFLLPWDKLRFMACLDLFPCMDRPFGVCSCVDYHSFWLAFHVHRRNYGVIQKEAKRLMAYHCISQTGYMLMGIVRFASAIKSASDE